MVCSHWIGWMLLALGWQASDFHAFYVSTCYVRWDRAQVQLDTRVFRDDFELGLRQFTGDPSWQLSRDSASTVVRSYLAERVALYFGDRQVDLRLESISFDGEGATEIVLCKLAASDSPPRPPVECKIYNDLLTEVYDDQVNMIHVKLGERRKSKNLDKDDPYFTFTLSP